MEAVVVFSFIGSRMLPTLSTSVLQRFLVAFRDIGEHGNSEDMHAQK